MKISEWLTINTVYSTSGLTRSALLAAYRASTGIVDALSGDELLSVTVEPGADPRTNRQLRFPATLTTGDIARWLELNATVVSETGDNRERIADLIQRCSRIEPTLDNLDSVLIRLPANTLWRFKGFTFETWINANTRIVNDLTEGDPARKIAESFCRSQGLGYDAGTLTALCSELDRLHYVYGSQSFLKLNNYIV